MRAVVQDQACAAVCAEPAADPVVLNSMAGLGLLLFSALAFFLVPSEALMGEVSGELFTRTAALMIVDNDEKG